MTEVRLFAKVQNTSKSKYEEFSNYCIYMFGVGRRLVYAKVLDNSRSCRARTCCASGKCGMGGLFLPFRTRLAYVSRPSPSTLRDASTGPEYD